MEIPQRTRPSSVVVCEAQDRAAPTTEEKKQSEVLLSGGQIHQKAIDKETIRLFLSTLDRIKGSSLLEDDAWDPLAGWS